MLTLLVFVLFIVGSAFRHQGAGSKGRARGQKYQAAMEPKYYEAVVAPAYIPFPTITRDTKPKQITPADGGDDRFKSDLANEGEVEEVMTSVRKDQATFSLLRKLTAGDIAPMNKLDTLRNSKADAAFALGVYESPAGSPLSEGIEAGDLLEDWNMNIK